MQRRINIFGDLIDTADLPEMVASIMAPGRLQGNGFSVAASDLMTVAPGSCLLPDGVLVVEDESKNLVVPGSSLAADYTVMYQLEDSRTLGGSPALLRLLGGIKRQQDFKDGTILGWIRYPGGSVPLSPAFFIQPSPLRITNRADVFHYINPCPLSAIRPEAPGWTEATEYVLSEACTRFANGLAAPSSYELSMPFVITGAGQPRKLAARISVDFNCLVTFSIMLKGEQIELSPNGGLASNTGTLVTKEFDIPSGSHEWQAGTTAVIRAVIDAQPGRGASFAYTGLTLEPTPFTLFA